MVAPKQRVSPKKKRCAAKSTSLHAGLIAGLEAGLSGQAAPPQNPQDAKMTALEVLKNWNPPELLKYQKRIHQTKN